LIRLVANVDGSGRYGFLLRLRFHDPNQTSALDIVRMWHYLLLRALRCPSVQTHGFIMMGDLSGASFGNLDTRIPKTILGALSKNMPARVHRIFVVRPFMMMRMVVPILRMFLSKKLSQRLVLVSDPTSNAQLKENVDLKLLPYQPQGSESAFDSAFRQLLDEWRKEEEERRTSRAAAEAAAAVDAANGSSSNQENEQQPKEASDTKIAT